MPRVSRVSGRAGIQEMVNQTQGSLPNSGAGNGFATITHSTCASEPSDVAVTETLMANHRLAGSADFVGAIDTTSVASADGHTPYYPGTRLARPSAQPRRRWNAGPGSKTPACTWFVILLSGLSGFLIAGTFMVARSLWPGETRRVIALLPSTATWM